MSDNYTYGVSLSFLYCKNDTTTGDAITGTVTVYTTAPSAAASPPTTRRRATARR